MPIVLTVVGFFAPRFVLGLLWFFTDRMYEAFGNWQAPFLGFIFLPYATLVYTILVSLSGSLSFFGWIVVALALVLDMNRWADSLNKNRNGEESEKQKVQSPGAMIIEGEAH